MNIVVDKEGLIVETPQTLQPLANYVRKNQRSFSINGEFECINQIYKDGVFLIQPTPFHTASKYDWILNDMNHKILAQTVDMICTQIMLKFDGLNDTKWFQQVSDILVSNNKARSYILLRKLITSAPSYIDVSHYFE